MPNSGLTKAALGEIPCDLLIENCRLVDVFSGTICNDSVVAIKDGVFVGVNDGLAAIESYDAGGRYMVPGFIDSHVHIESSLLIPAEYASLAVPRGTTAVIADPHEIVNVMGYDGMVYMLHASEGLPLRVFFTLPSCVPATSFDSAGADFFAADMHRFVNDERVLGLGEVMNYPGVLAGEPSLMDKIALFKAARKALEGHAPGLRGRVLSAYAAVGIKSDHESTTADEAREKLSKGLWVMIREGSAARDLAVLAAAVTPANARRFLLCSDDRHPGDLKREGHIDRMLRLLVAGGVNAIDAIRMASLNPAERYCLPNIGAIAPGFKADINLLDDLKGFRVAAVFKDGRLVARDGHLIDKKEEVKDIPRDSVNIKWLEESDFGIKKQGKQARVIVAEIGSLITGERWLEPLIDEAGYCLSDPTRDLLRLYVIERHRGSGQIGRGFIQGLGLKSGAIGSTISHDSHNLIIAGVDDKSIFKAARHLNKIGGGLVATQGDEVLVDLPLPVAGLMSLLSADETIARMDAFDRYFADRGGASADTLMTLSFMALPVIPSLKLTDRGLVDVDKFTRVELFR